MHSGFRGTRPDLLGLKKIQTGSSQRSPGEKKYIYCYKKTRWRIFAGYSCYCGDFCVKLVNYCVLYLFSLPVKLGRWEATPHREYCKISMLLDMEQSNISVKFSIANTDWWIRVRDGDLIRPWSNCLSIWCLVSRRFSTTYLPVWVFVVSFFLFF